MLRAKLGKGYETVDKRSHGQTSDSNPEERRE